MRNSFFVAICALFLVACTVIPMPDQALFAWIVPGRTTQAELQQRLGRPADTTYLSLRDLTVWSYKYRESGVWPSLMHVHMDRSGVVRELQSGPDPDYEERRFFR